MRRGKEAERQAPRRINCTGTGTGKQTDERKTQKKRTEMTTRRGRSKKKNNGK